MDQLSLSFESRLIRRIRSSGLFRVKVYNKHGMAQRNGTGMFPREVMNRFPLLPLEEEGRLNDMPLRENFIERVFAYYRWTEMLDEELAPLLGHAFSPFLRFRGGKVVTVTFAIWTGLTLGEGPILLGILLGLFLLIQSADAWSVVLTMLGFLAHLLLRQADSTTLASGVEIC